MDVHELQFVPLIWTSENDWRWTPTRSCSYFHTIRSSAMRIGSYRIRLTGIGSFIVCKTSSIKCKWMFNVPIWSIRLRTIDCTPGGCRWCHDGTFLAPICPFRTLWPYLLYTLRDVIFLGHGNVLLYCCMVNKQMAGQICWPPFFCLSSRNFFFFFFIIFVHSPSIVTSISACHSNASNSLLHRQVVCRLNGCNRAAYTFLFNA